jgi:hypothetical protein
MEYVKRWWRLITLRPDQTGHNDRDYACHFWWGDRSGSAVGVSNERCPVCNPVKMEKPTGDYWTDLGGPGTSRGDYY